MELWLAFTGFEEIKIFHELVNRKILIVKLPFCLGAIKTVPYIKKLGHAVNMAAICAYGQALVASSPVSSICRSTWDG
jgi:hypothetical protein